MSENATEPTIDENMEAQEQAIDLSDLLNLLRESLIDHEVRLMNIEGFLGTLMENIKAEMEAEIEDATVDAADESAEHPPV